MQKSQDDSEADTGPNQQRQAEIEQVLRHTGRDAADLIMDGISADYQRQRDEQADRPEQDIVESCPGRIPPG